MAALLFASVLMVHESPVLAKTPLKVMVKKTPLKVMVKKTPTNCYDKDCPIPKGCIRSDCPKPLCADPVLKYGKCCPSCETSRCKFEGCVQYEPDGVTWYASPCRMCQCRGGRTICMGPRCGFPAPCPAGTVLTKVGYRPYHCCPYCDYGAPEQGCQTVPIDLMHQFQDSAGKCSGSYPSHQCDKVGFRRHGRKFRCVETRGERRVNLTGVDCGSYTYDDVLSCEPKEDPSVYRTLGCDLYVHS